MSRTEDGLTITNTYLSPKTDITVSKVWVDGPEEHPDIQLQLMRNGEVFGDLVTLTDGVTTHTWTALDLTDANGVEYVYQVDELEIDNYAMTRYEDGLTITNTYVSPKIDVTGHKVWVGGSPKHPTIQLQLFRNDEAFLDAVDLVDGTAAYTWTDLDERDRNGELYTYRVDEVRVPLRYIKTISEDGLTVTNTYKPIDPRKEPPVVEPPVVEEPKQPIKVVDVPKPVVKAVEKVTPVTGIENVTIEYIGIILLGLVILLAVIAPRRSKKHL